MTAPVPLYCPDPPTETFERVLGRLDVASRNGTEARARCPAHDDESPSLSIGVGHDGKVLFRCHAGCTTGAITKAVGLTLGDLFPGGVEGSTDPPRSAASVHRSRGCTLEDYAEAKKIPLENLRGFDLAQIHYGDGPAVRIGYLDAEGSEVAVRFRVSMDGPERFRWRRGDKPRLYGLWRLQAAREAGYAVIVEGESDCHTLWLDESRRWACPEPTASAASGPTTSTASRGCTS